MAQQAYDSSGQAGGAQGSVFGDLGGSGVAGQEGGAAISNAVPSTGPPGQGGR